jgi:hypothetical protein
VVVGREEGRRRRRGEVGRFRRQGSKGIKNR